MARHCVCLSAVNRIADREWAGARSLRFLLWGEVWGLNPEVTAGDWFFWGVSMKTGDHLPGYRFNFTFARLSSWLLPPFR
ncbi:hypothetical protein AGR13a_Lc110161 [Agrobacterium genomosp. 13 str. CFBP 6927]|uniref:Uncharacterized protein n=1 Tax=Agrobacterium genomosp. 13 str. CFBP 6927 TaxID=1183428 RepID=A0ABM9VK57_9HYPH|nr:hypothetical protein AGR13a_Lc110161 [Agrobacterium genomosp. 13 str. CFBP 6927]